MNRILTQEQFEDILFNSELTIVQKEVQGYLEHHTYAYVYENNRAIYAAVRYINENGTSYWKETI
ncbi:cef modifier of supressor tRNAs [Salmonella phage vB_SnwM_CGG4-1]|uniref:Modifier of suppressor tRNAs n=1 Tax=Salmonella phage vB_SnwM_CGG4-1 TaxID=1815631 RepID=A0A1B0VV65_9CAUD|nr:cef modifier of supressor tRNAs [Salmonella phage vB_SnwM_CGG4-1]ANA49363.1 modifier of suppressor tRNAs [Salmonella phage vB_SnwM_CGG4-1]